MIQFRQKRFSLFPKATNQIRRMNLERKVRECDKYIQSLQNPESDFSEQTMVDNHEIGAIWRQANQIKDHEAKKQFMLDAFEELKRKAEVELEKIK